MFFLYHVIRFFSLIFDKRIFSFFSRLGTIVYSFSLSRFFKSFDCSSRLNHPITIKGAKYISLGKNSGVGARSILSAWDTYESSLFNPNISIGDNVWIGEDAHITSINSITIGNGVLMGKKVTITDNSHGQGNITELSLPPAKRALFSRGPVIINENVWIGDKVTVLPNVSIGKNSVIGANSVVTKDIPENAIAAGVPAVVIRYMK